MKIRKNATLDLNDTVNLISLLLFIKKIKILLESGIGNPKIRNPQKIQDSGIRRFSLRIRRIVSPKNYVCSQNDFLQFSL